MSKTNESLKSRINRLKYPIEANIVGILWSKPEYFVSDSKLGVDSFSDDTWRLFFSIGKKLHEAGVEKFDKYAVGLFLDKHSEALKARYDKMGGYATIKEMMGYSSIENYESYIKMLNKYNLVLGLIEKGFPLGSIADKIEKMTTMEIYEYYEAHLNDLFINVDEEVKSYDLSDGLIEIVEEADKGVNIGMPFLSQALNEQIGGAIDGQILQLGGLSGTGKSTVTASIHIASCVIHKERVVVMINEEDEKKWKRDMITWVANNKIKGGDFNKKRWRKGGFSEEEKAVLHEATQWLEDKLEAKQIILVPIPRYTVGTAIQLIKKYSAIGVKKFVLDTFKAGYDADDSAIWLSMMQDMRKLYDVVKPSQKNVHLWVTFQLNKASVKMRYLTQDNIGMAKNIIDVASVCLLTRRVYDDELSGGTNELNVWKYPEGAKNPKPIPVVLDHTKNYVIVFIEKNRNGASQEHQIVAEVDLGKNIYQEVGFTSVPRDF